MKKPSPRIPCIKSFSKNSNVFWWVERLESAARERGAQPDRTESNKGFDGDPKFALLDFSTTFI